MSLKIKKLFKLSLSEIILLIKDIILINHNENIIRLIRHIKKLTNNNTQNKLIIDIGAFDGNTSIALSKAFPNSTILAFEPNENAFNLAIKNCQAHKKINLSNIALSDKNGESEFNITKNQVSSSLNSLAKEAIDSSQQDQLSVKKKLLVKTLMLDELKINEEILLVKIDVQGHEKEVLTGGKNTLKNVCFILIELNNHNIYSGSSKYYEVDLWLRQNNFRLADIIVTYRKNGVLITEYDAIYVNNLKYSN